MASPLRISASVFLRSDVVVEVRGIKGYPGCFVCEVTGDGTTPRLTLHGTAQELLNFADQLVAGLLEGVRSDSDARARFNLALDQAVGRWQTQIVEALF